MPFVLLIIGILFLVVAIQGTQSQAFSMLRSEFTGNNSFVVFAAAIIILGALAYVKPIRPIAFAMIGLILMAMILANKGGFFTQLNNALRNPVTPNAVTVASSAPANAASTTLQTVSSSILPGVQNPYFATPGQPLAPGISPPETGGGFGQY